MRALIYVLSYAAFPIFGWSCASRIDDRVARVGFAFLAGGLLLTIEATLFTVVGIPWSAWALSIPLLLLLPLPRTAASTHPVRSLPLGVTVVALLHFLLSIITTQSISPDYVLFWGTKASRFALARAIDPHFLLSPFPPPRVDYPPLVPVVEAWGALFSREMPWIAAAAMSAVWLAAAVPVIRWLTKSWEATAFWTAAMCASQAFSGGGGNAEPMLVAFLSVGAAAIVANETFIAAIAFAGAALTKEEAFLVIAAILLTAGIRRAAILAASSLGAASVWFLYQWRFGMHVGYERFAMQTHLLSSTLGS